MDIDEFMEAAIGEARKGLSEGGIPIGSVLVMGGRIVGRGHNLRVQEDDPMAHAEIVCLRDAGRIGSYRDTVLHSTLMPCYLCDGVVVQFGIRKVVAGESRTFKGAGQFMEHHGVEVVDLDNRGCYVLMEDFIRRNPELWYEDIGKS